jgi:hypothetical protein
MEMPEESIVEMMHQVHEVERKKRDIFFKNAAKFIDEFLSGLTEEGVPEIETNRFRQQMLDLKIIRDAVEDVIPKVKAWCLSVVHGFSELYMFCWWDERPH